MRSLVMPAYLSFVIAGNLVTGDRMYRLSDNLAKKRLLYPSPLISAPSVLVIDVPPLNRGTALPLGRYYPIILQTEDECAEIERFLIASRQEPVRPDIFDLRPSQLRSDNVLISRYNPPLPNGHGFRCAAGRISLRGPERRPAWQWRAAATRWRCSAWRRSWMQAKSRSSRAWATVTRLSCGCSPQRRCRWPGEPDR